MLSRAVDVTSDMVKAGIRENMITVLDIVTRQYQREAELAVTSWSHVHLVLVRPPVCYSTDCSITPPSSPPKASRSAFGRHAREQKESVASRSMPTTGDA